MMFLVEDVVQRGGAAIVEVRRTSPNAAQRGGIEDGLPDFVHDADVEGAGRGISRRRMAAVASTLLEDSASPDAAGESEICTGGGGSDRKYAVKSATWASVGGSPCMVDSIDLRT